MDSIYSGLDHGRSQELPLLALRLILVIRRAPQASLVSDEAAAPVVILSGGGPDSILRSTSLTYLLRCPALISLSTRNFRLWHLLVLCP